MELTYIFHSGFMLEMKHCILVFDYWKDPARVIDRCFRAPVSKPVYVFSSHFHEDHFNRQILAWRTLYPSVRFTYILSKDILRHRRASKPDADVWLAKGGTWEDSYIQVIATGSNDSGVSWVVTCEGRRIFHAGDLCNWYARFLTDASPDDEVYSEEMEMRVNPVQEEKRFLGELKDIRKCADAFDVVMFPVDGRIGNGYTLGARQFIERFRVGLFVPMHFALSGFESAHRMQPFCQERDITFWCIQAEGERVSILDHLLIRYTTSDDLPALLTLFAQARQFMKATGNATQWAADYPGEALLRDDMQQGASYVFIYKAQLVGTFVLRPGQDPTYAVIYDGAWMNEQPYVTIHRIAGNGRVKGLFHCAIQFARQRYTNIRIDTHRNNIVMQKTIMKEGFRYCGIIHTKNGSERLAYQWTLK